MNPEFKKNRPEEDQVGPCPVSGLPRRNFLEWKSPRKESDYKVRLHTIGTDIVHIRAEGYVTLEDVESGLEVIDRYLAMAAGPDGKVAGIEDYRGVTGASADARRYYVKYFRECPHLSLAVVYGVPLLLKTSYRLAFRLFNFKYKLVVVDAYEQAIGLVLDERVTETPPEASIHRGLDFVPAAGAAAGKAGSGSRLWAGLKNLFGREKTSEVSEPAGPGPPPSWEEIAQYRDELLRFIASINWEENGHIDYAHNIPRSNPFRPVFDAVSYIKADLDQLFAQRAAARQALRDRETRFQQLVDHARAGLFQIDPESGLFLNTNEVMSDFTGFSKAELQEMTLFDLISDEDELRIRGILKKTRAVEDGVGGIELRINEKGGRRHWVLLNLKAHQGSGAELEVTGVATDITRRKMAEDSLLDYQKRLRKLGAELSKTEETERRRIAGLLHDRVSQQLAAAIIWMSTVKASLAQPEAVQKMDQAIELVRDAVRESRSLTAELSPPILYELGFPFAMDWLAEKFSAEFGLEVRVDRGREEPHLSEETRNALFRGLVELLHNVVKHAESDRVEITFKRVDDRVRLEVRDWGRGFDQSLGMTESLRGDGFGHFNIRERLSYLGGSFQVRSAPGRGTSVVMIAPVKADPA